MCRSEQGSELSSSRLRAAAPALKSYNGWAASAVPVPCLAAACSAVAGMQLHAGSCWLWLPPAVLVPGAASLVLCAADAVPLDGCAADAVPLDGCAADAVPLDGCVPVIKVVWGGAGLSSTGCLHVTRLQPAAAGGPASRLQLRLAP